MAVALVFSASCSKTTKDDSNATGSIYGVINDKSTGEPVAVVGVKLSPSGKSTGTGSDGVYGFAEVNPGTYTLQIDKEGYKLATKENVVVEAGKSANVDLLIERIPAVVTVDRDMLDFGDNESNTILSFSIVNSSRDDLTWEIQQSCPWIKTVNPASGTLKSGKTENIVVVIDRNQLEGGANETKVVVVSSDGRSELTVTATGKITNVPIVSTEAVSDITASSAVFNGNITSPGSPSYSERGFVYATTSQPALDKTIRKVTAAVNSSAAFSANVEGLELNIVYYVRAYAINDIGTAYGNEVSFMAKALPALNTLSVSNITSSTAKFNAMITSVGSPAYTERGFVFAITSQPTLSTTIRKITAATSSDESYSADVNGLSLNTTYYVRSYATNSEGTAYGNEVSFTSGAELATLTTTTAVSITTTSAVLGGNIMTTGTPAYTERGVCYSTSSMPTDNNSKTIIAGSGTGNFSQQISGFSQGTKYYVRAYAKTGNSGTAYGEEISFTTYAPATVNTQSVTNTNITTSTAKVSGNIVNVGVPSYTEKGICYSTSNNPTIETAFKFSVSGTGIGAYSADINNLDANTTYYARAYAINEIDVVYGNTVNFKTKIEVATVSTQAVSTISGSQVQLNGTIVTAGNPSYTERGFVYGSSNFPTVSNTKVMVAGSGTGSFSATVSYGNNYLYSYHVRAYAINADGSVSYGDDQMFFFDVQF